MTTREATELERAIERATAAGLIVLAQGRFKADNRRFWLVPSQSEPERTHVVLQFGRRLVCDCKATVLCAHKGAVHMHLVVEAEKLRTFSDQVESGLREEAFEHEDHARGRITSAAAKAERAERMAAKAQAAEAVNVNVSVPERRQDDVRALVIRQARDEAQRRETAPLSRPTTRISIFR